MRNHDMDYIRSREFGEEIEYYVDDLNYSDTVMGCGLETGKPYLLTFDETGHVVEIEEAKA